MHDPRTLLLSITNIVLGLVVILCAAAILMACFSGAVERWKRRRAINAELDSYEDRLFGFHTSGRR